MKKKLKRIVCFLLAFVVMVSIPLDIQAHAVATETWMVYALITYLAGMGITFTVSGGVNAMIQAMEEKVKDYEQQNNIIDFYEYVRNNNVRLLPNNNQDPDGNPFFDLFFTGAAVEAIQAFANWLTSEGGLSSENVFGSTQETTIFLSSNDMQYYENISFGTLGEIVVDDAGCRIYEVAEKGTEVNEGSLWPNNSNYRLIFYNPTGYDGLVYWFTRFVNKDAWHFGKGTDGADFYASDLVAGYTIDDVVSYSIYKADYLNPNVVFVGLNLSDGRVAVPYPYSWASNTSRMEVTTLSQRVEIITPEELQEQFPSVDQGVSIKDAISVPMGDPTLAEWAQRMEETFDLTGTIPKPVPEVIADPDVVPQPSPVPTPPVYEDVDDLGLPSLAETMKNKFPFCLPYDLGRVFQIFYAEPVAPYWEVDLFSTLGNRVPFVGDTSFTIDLAEYDELGVISRWMTTIGYVLLLILITRQTTKW